MTLFSPFFMRQRLLIAFGLICLCLAPALAFAQTAVAPTSGDGATTSTAYQITSLQNLVWLQAQAAASATSGKYYALANDINLSSTSLSTYNSGSGFLPIGTYALPFQGTFLGNGHTISHLKINRTSTNQIGLFGAVQGGTVRDLSLTHVSIKGAAYVGGLTGTLKTNANLYNCSVSGTVSGTGASVGGLAGEAPSGNTNIMRCSAAVAVTGSSTDVGGLIGCLYTNSGTQTVSQCFATGIVTATNRSANYGYIGGLVGRAENYTTQTISQCFASGDVFGSGLGVGGLIGNAYNSGTQQAIERCYAVNNVIGDDCVGGLVGWAKIDSGTQTISQCFATGNVMVGTVYSPEGIFGGLIGAWNSWGGVAGTQIVERCFATGNVSGGSGSSNNGTGGLIGYQLAGTAQICSQSYSSGSVSNAGSNVGGLVGWIYTSFTCTDCYWDTERSGLSSAVNGGSHSGVTGATTAEMQTASTFSNWDFTNDWGLDLMGDCNGGYPYLRATDVIVFDFAINDCDTTTTSRVVTLTNLAGFNPTHYAASEDPDFRDASWLSYTDQATFALSAGAGTKTVYFKVMNNYGTSAAADNVESDVISASIELAGADCGFVKGSVALQSAHSESYAKKTAAITSKDTYAFKSTVNLPTDFSLASVTADTQVSITVGDWTFSESLNAAVSKSLKGAKGGSAVFRTQVLVGKTKKTTQIVTLTWTSKRVLKVVVTGTPITETGSTVTTNILNALSVDDGTVAAKVPVAVTFGEADARDDVGVTCAGTRTTTAVKNTSVSLNKWVMSGKK